MPAQQPQSFEFAEARCHLPPPTVSRKTPRSGKFGSLSSLRDLEPAERQLAVQQVGSDPGVRRWNVVTCTEATPSTACAAAYKGLRIDGLAEGEVVGMEESAPAVRRGRGC